MAQPTRMPPRRPPRRPTQEERVRRALLRARQPRDSGRAWINGVEVGGADPRFAHLDRSYD